MKFRTCLHLISFIAFLSLLFLACRNPKDPNVSSENGLLMNDKDLVEKDNAQVDKNIGAYSYIIEPGDLVVPVVEPKKTINNDEDQTAYNRSTDVPKKLEEPDMEKVTSTHKDNLDTPLIELSLKATLADIDINRPPVYGIDCLKSEYPIQCSSDKVADFIKNNLKYPEGSVQWGDKGTVEVSFRVTKEGNVENIRVSENEKPCVGCANAAIEVVKDLPDKWAPALKNGQAVPSTISMPIVFFANRYK